MLDRGKFQLESEKCKPVRTDAAQRKKEDRSGRATTP